MPSVGILARNDYLKSSSILATKEQKSDSFSTFFYGNCDKGILNYFIFVLVVKISDINYYIKFKTVIL